MLEGVGEGTASEPHTVGHHRKTLLGEHDCGRFAGDIRGPINGDPHIGRVEYRAVVDAVAEVSDRLPASLGRRDDLLLLPGLDLGKDVAFRDGSTQSGGTHPVDFGTGDDEPRAQSNAGCHRLGHETIVTAHHDDPHPERGEIGDLDVHVVFDVVTEGQKADEVAGHLTERCRRRRLMHPQDGVVEWVAAALLQRRVEGSEVEDAGILAALRRGGLRELDGSPP